MSLNNPPVVLPRLRVGQTQDGDYSEFEADGTLRFRGDATTWRDEFGSVVSSRIESPSSDIIQDLAEVTITFKDSAVYPTDFIAYNLQINHDWLIDSLVDFHAHWFQASAANVNWLLEYRWQINGQLKTAGWTPLALTGSIFAYDAGTLVQINEAAAMITPPGTAYLSEIFQVKLYRDYTNVSTLFAGAESSGLDVDLLFADMHRKSDTSGSREEYVK